MSVDTSTDLQAYCHIVARQAKQASADLMQVSGQQKNDWLIQSATRLCESIESLEAANQLDIASADKFGLSDAQIDRLRLSPERIEGIARGLRQIAELPEPIGEIMSSAVRPNGLLIQKVRVPLGVVFFIYESRPNVTADAAAICLKSGNAVILRGGKEAAHSSQAIVDVMVESAAACGLPQHALQLVSTADRAAVGHFLQMSELIDVAIPRGGEGLIRRVAAEATMPVIKHFDGNCHVYIDEFAKLEMARAVTVNSKTQRLGVCNAAESLLIHSAVAAKYLPPIAEALAEKQIEIRGDATTCELCPNARPADESDYATEYLGPVISCRVVESLDMAIEHINRYGSGHTDAIVTCDLQNAREFTRRVDSSAVMVNASTRFNDGYQFGLGAEIGISTDKFHARGPCGVNELTSYKYIVQGDGQIL